MKRIIILTESGTDLPAELAKLHQIEVIPMHVIMDDAHYQDGTFPVTRVYDYYKRTRKIPSTAATNPDEFEQLYHRLTAENPGCVIVHISYSSKASSTYQNALIASRGVDNVLHVDSQNVSGGEATVVLKAAALLAQKPDIAPAELVKQIEACVTRVRASFIPGNLEYLKAGGRLSNAAYLGATFLHMKPLIEIINGELVATKKYIGTMGHIAERYMNETFERFRFEKEQLYLLFSLGLETHIKQRMEDIAKEHGFKKITWIQTGCVISTHSGPGAIGISGFEA